MKRAALIIAALLIASTAHSDGIFNPSGFGVGSFEGPHNSGTPVAVSCVPGAPNGQMDFSVCSNIAITAAVMP
jgi:hypothetical protein